MAAQCRGSPGHRQGRRWCAGPHRRRTQPHGTRRHVESSALYGQALNRPPRRDEGSGPNCAVRCCAQDRDPVCPRREPSDSAARPTKGRLPERARSTTLPGSGHLLKRAGPARSGMSSSSAQPDPVSRTEESSNCWRAAARPSSARKCTGGYTTARSTPGSVWRNSTAPRTTFGPTGPCARKEAATHWSRRRSTWRRAAPCCRRQPWARDVRRRLAELEIA